jgi:glyoxylase I family protein
VVERSRPNPERKRHVSPTTEEILKWLILAISFLGFGGHRFTAHIGWKTGAAPSGSPPDERMDMAIDIRGMAPLLQVFDMPTSIKFYCDILGFEIVGTDGKTAPHFDWVLLGLNGVELMLNTAYESLQRPSSPEPARIAAHEDTGLFFGCPDVDATYRYLSGMGVKATEPKVATYGMKQLNVTDPDGYGLCFQWRAA